MLRDIRSSARALVDRRVLPSKLWPLLGLVLLAGCGFRFEGSGRAAVFGNAIIDSHVGDLVLQGFLGALLGGILGVFSGLVLFFILRALGAYRWEWKHAKWIRVLVAFGTVGFFGFLVGSIGLMEGALRGGTVVIRKSQLATEVFPKAGDAGADLLFVIERAVPRAKKGGKLELTPEDDASLEEFRTGKTKLDLKSLLENLDSTSEDVIRAGTAEVMSRVATKVPSLQKGTARELVEWVVVKVGKFFLSREVAKKLEDEGIALDPQALAANLRAGAKEEGDPDHISRVKVSDLIVTTVVEPSIIGPASKLVRGHQLVLVAGLLAVLAVPIATFAILRSKKVGHPKPPSEPEKPEGAKSSV